MKQISDELFEIIESGKSLHTFPDGCDPNTHGDFSLLSLATESTNMDNIRLLKKHGATLEKSIMYGGQMTYMEGAAIYIAAELNDLRLLKCVFEGEDVSKWSDAEASNQALYYAIKIGNYGMVDYLIDTVGVKLSKTGDIHPMPCWSWDDINHFSATDDQEMLSYIETKYQEQK